MYWLEYPGTKEAGNLNKWSRHNIGGSDKEIKFISTGDLDGDGSIDVIAIDTKSVICSKEQRKDGKNILYRYQRESAEVRAQQFAMLMAMEKKISCSVVRELKENCPE